MGGDWWMLVLPAAAAYIAISALNLKKGSEVLISPVTDRDH